MQTWSDEEVQQFAGLISDGVGVDEAAQSIGKNFAAGVYMLDSIAHEKGRAEVKKKIPRGKGYDKASIEKFVAELETTDLSFVQFCKTKLLKPNLAGMALVKYFPERWEAYKETHEVEYQPCLYDAVLFIPSSTKQLYCDSKCSAKARRDKDYFGGKRLEALGLQEDECQLCLRPHKAFHVHHIIGHNNDPDNNHMIALCPGCHQLVSYAARHRTLIKDARMWEKLIALVWFEANGETVADTGEGLNMDVRVVFDGVDEVRDS